MAKRTVQEIEKLEDELKLLFDARIQASKQGNLDQTAFLKRIGQLYLFGSISESAFRIAEFMYGTETACQKIKIEYQQAPSGNGRC